MAWNWLAVAWDFIMHCNNCIDYQKGKSGLFIGKCNDTGIVVFNVDYEFSNKVRYTKQI